LSRCSIDSASAIKILFLSEVCTPMEMETPETRLTYIVTFATAIAHTMPMQRERVAQQPEKDGKICGQEEREELQGGVRG
jgi:hypothetical protein